MNTIEIVNLAVELAAKYLPQAIETGEKLFVFAENFYKQLSGKELTDEERAELRRQVDAAYERAIEPLSPAQPGDPDYIKSSEEN